jgi:hypothetical protein
VWTPVSVGQCLGQCGPRTSHADHPRTGECERHPALVRLAEHTLPVRCRQGALSAAGCCRSIPSPTPSLECSHPCAGQQEALDTGAAMMARQTTAGT